MKKITFYFLMMLIMTQSVFSQNLYVSLSGSDSNPGTEILPFATIQHAANVATAGDNIFVAAGTYNQTVALNNKFGTQTAPIRFIAQGTAILDGGGILAPASSTLWHIQNCSNISVQGFSIRNMINDDVRGLMIENNSTYVTIKDCSIYDIQCLNITGNAHPFIALCSSSTQPITNLTITGNHVYNCQTGHSEGMTLNGNIDQFYIFQNVVQNISNIGICIAGNKSYGASSVPSTNHARNGVVAENNVSSCFFPGVATAGIYVDGGWDTIVERNVVTDGSVGIAINCESPGTTERITIRSNIIYRNNDAAIIVSSVDAGQNVKDCSVIGNTTYANDMFNNWRGELIVYSSLNTIIKNNIFYATNGHNRISYCIPVGGVASAQDYNLYYSSTGNYEFVYNSLPYTSISTLQAASNENVHSFIADPLLVDALSFNFHLQDTSPAINSGDPSITADWDDFDGDIRNIGGIMDCGADEWTALSTEIKEETNIILYPNPCKNILHVNSNNIGEFNFKIYSYTGQLVLNAVCQSGEIDTEMLAPGVYFLKIEPSNKSIMRFVKL